MRPAAPNCDDSKTLTTWSALPKRRAILGTVALSAASDAQLLS